MTRIIPYPPNFNRIAAKIIDPATGASTWALGNHRWVINIGNLTKNPLIKNIFISAFILLGGERVNVNIFVDSDQ